LGRSPGIRLSLVKVKNSAALQLITSAGFREEGLKKDGQGVHISENPLCTRRQQGLGGVMAG
jgi:hypothetical protein